MSYGPGAECQALEAVHAEDRQGYRAEFFFHLAAQQEGSGIEEHVAAAAVDVWKEHRLDESRAVVEGSELHRLVLGRMNRVGGGGDGGGEDGGNFLVVWLWGS